MRLLWPINWVRNWFVGLRISKKTNFWARLYTWLAHVALYQHIYLLDDEWVRKPLWEMKVLEVMRFIFLVLAPDIAGRLSFPSAISRASLLLIVVGPKIRNCVDLSSELYFIVRGCRPRSWIGTASRYLPFSDRLAAAQRHASPGLKPRIIRPNSIRSLLRPFGLSKGLKWLFMR